VRNAISKSAEDDSSDSSIETIERLAKDVNYLQATIAQLKVLFLYERELQHSINM
jgi:hypothetical protein